MNKKEVNILQYRTIDSATNKFMQNNTFGNESSAFLGMVLESYLDLDIYDIEDSIIDGSYDCGLDAIYIDDQSDSRPTIYLFQSKKYQNQAKFDRNFEGGALTKMKDAIHDFVLKNKKDKSYQNSKLQDKLNDISKIENPKYEIIFCSNSAHPTSRSKEQFEEFISDSDPSENYFSIKYLHLNEISDLIAIKQKRKVDSKLSFTGKYINDDNGNVRMFLGQIQVKEIAKLREQEGEEIFDKNVRGYLTRKNRINTSIQETASGDDSPYFVYLNNGLTIVCDDYTFGPTDESPVLEIKNIQIVNGGQTTNSIFESYQKKELKDNAYVLVKVLQIKKEDLLHKIILSTNSQTKVTSRDLHSNDDIQKLINKELLGYGYFYEARKNQYRDEKKAKNMRVDAELAAQSYYATVLKNPASAKNKKSLLFTDYYEQIFNTETNSIELLTSFLLYQKVRKINKEYRGEFTFVNDASLHIIAVLYFLKINSKEKIDNDDLFIEKYKSVLDAIKEVVEERIKEEGDSYSHRRTFIDTITFGRIIEAYEDKNR